MVSYKDRTFCASQGCINECGRKLTEEISKAAENAGMYIAIGYFCENEEDDDTLRERGVPNDSSKKR